MNRKIILPGLVLVTLFQVVVLATEYLGAIYPLWQGREIMLKVVPVDPRSLFRGNYAQLDYDISIIPSVGLDAEKLRVGEIVYVRLKQGVDGLYVFDSATLEQPKKGLYIRGRLTSPGWLARDSLQLRYGIEAWFAPKEKALTLERELRGGGVAQVMVAANGRAALKSVTVNLPTRSPSDQTVRSVISDEQLQLYYDLITEERVAAQRWLCKSADQGHPDARYRLALLYENGNEGFEKNYLQAYVWYTLSHESGNYWAGQHALRLRDNNLNHQTITLAEEIIRKWQPGQCEIDLGLDQVE